MKKQFLALLFAACTLIFGASMAHAKKPLAVDCAVLEGTLIGVDSVLPPGTFDNLGDLVSQAKKDPAVFGPLSGLIAFISASISGTPIIFTDPKEVVPTIAGCGLTPLLVELVTD